MKKSYIGSFLIVSAITSMSVNAADDGFTCKTRTDLVGPCWTVHGRLRVDNGNPSTRIWPIGTNRLLGVKDAFFNDDEESASPAEIRKYGFTAQIFADFLVCPLSKEKSGEMQTVCVSAARHIRVEQWMDKSLHELKPHVWLTPSDISE